MKKKINLSKKLVVAGLILSATLTGCSNDKGDFGIKEVPSQVESQADDHKCGEGKCGEAKADDHKCGEGKCGQ